MMAPTGSLPDGLNGDHLSLGAAEAVGRWQAAHVLRPGDGFLSLSPDLPAL